MHKSEEKGARTENGRETWGQAMRHRNPGLETGTVMMWRWDGINAKMTMYNREKKNSTVYKENYRNWKNDNKLLCHISD